MSDLDLHSASDFRRARAQAFLNKVWSLLSGRSRKLLAFDEVREKLRLGGPVYRGLQAIPLSKIVGSVNRYRDFDRFFLPTQSHTQERWRRINRAWYRDEYLPPVLLYKVGEVYFVIDGNHRVSVARARGQKFIDAEVRECETRVPLSEAIGPEELERLGARAEFLQRTRLDQVRPEAQIESTILGGYDRLVEHIAVHRYFMGLEAGQEIPVDEAVAHWYDALYKPVAEVIERSGILETFPGRTVTDLYLWVMDHLHFLRERLGDESLSPDQAAEDFVRTLKDGGDQ